MGDKKRKTFSLDPEVHAFLTEENADLNASSVVNSLLREYRAVGKTKEAALEKRLRDIEDRLRGKRQEKAHIETEIDRLERQRDDAAERLRQLENARHDAVLEVASLIRSERQKNLTRDDLTPDHDLVVSRCGESDLTPEQFLRELDQELADRGGSA